LYLDATFKTSPIFKEEKNKKNKKVKQCSKLIFLFVCLKDEIHAKQSQKQN